MAHPSRIIPGASKLRNCIPSTNLLDSPGTDKPLHSASSLNTLSNIFPTRTLLCMKWGEGMEHSHPTSWTIYRQSIPKYTNEHTIKSSRSAQTWLLSRGKNYALIRHALELSTKVYLIGRRRCLPHVFSSRWKLSYVPFVISDLQDF